MFNPEYPNIYRILKQTFNSIIFGRYSWYNAWWMPLYIAERMLPLMYNVRRGNYHDPFIPAIFATKHEWMNVLNDIVFALEYYIYNEYQFNPIRYKKLKKRFKAEYGWPTNKIENFKVVRGDWMDNFLVNFEYETDYVLMDKMEARMKKGFESMGKYFLFLNS